MSPSAAGTGDDSDLRIESVRAIPTVSGFFFDDQRAIKDGAAEDGFVYEGSPVTAGFDRIREPGAALTVELTFSNGAVATGDCCAVQYSGAGGRDPLFRPEEHRHVVEDRLGDALIGRDPAAFGGNVAVVESRSGDLHTAVRYGVSQALLDAAATAVHTTKTDVLADWLGTTPAREPVPVFGQSGDDRRRNAEKMLCKGVGVLPHGLFNSQSKVGTDGERLVEYLSWLADRAGTIGPEEYRPQFHVDVYGTIGDVFGPPYDRTDLLDYFATLADAAAPYSLQVEGPMDEGGRAEQIHAMAELREGLADVGVDVDIVADEWCNTFEDIAAFVDAGAADLVQVKTPDLGGIQQSARAVDYCTGTDARAYLGGTCNETDVSARACAHVALATNAAQVLAKPGMGFDEGYMIVTNEQRRAIDRRRRSAGTGGTDNATMSQGSDTRTGATQTPDEGL